MRARVLAALLVVAGCREHARPQPAPERETRLSRPEVPDATPPVALGGGPSPFPSATFDERRGPSLPALETAAEIDALTVPGRRAAVIAIPRGARSKRPILVAAHGRDDMPEPLCEMWREVVGTRGFVVCPRGVPSTAVPGTFTYDSPEALAAEIDDAVAALRARFAAHVAEGPLVYAGFSLGSFHGVSVVTRDPQKTPRVVLIEGGHDPWDRDRIGAFRDGGGERVLFVTGQRVNLERSQRVARELEEVGILTRIEHAEGAGHIYRGEVQACIARGFEWLIEGDERWRE